MRSNAAASLSSPVPRLIARSMLSFGMLAARARSTARRKPKFVSGSPPPSRAANAISRARRVNRLPRLASLAAFLRLIVDHLECPDMLLAAPPTSPVKREGDHDAELYHRGFDSVFAASVLLRTEPFGASTSGRRLCGPPLRAENFPSLSGARPATSQVRGDPAGEVEGPSALRRPPHEPRYVHDNSAPGWAPASASLWALALRLRQHRPQRPKRVDTLAAIVVVGVDQHDLGLLLQELQPGEPFFELAIRI